MLSIIVQLEHIGDVGVDSMIVTLSRALVNRTKDYENLP